MEKTWLDQFSGGERLDAASIFHAGLERADPLFFIPRCLSLSGSKLTVSTGTDSLFYDLRDYEKVLLTGYGKASARMALAVEGIIGTRIDSGFVVTKQGHTERLSRATLFEASHPVPDFMSEEAARRLLEIAHEADEKTLVISCVSGGGSSLLCAPAYGLSLEEKQAINSLLLASGAPIEAVNCVRKHVSEIKGGWLAKALYPAQSLNLILSDVMGDDLSVIASGPTVGDITTWADAITALKRYGVLERLGASTRDIFERGFRHALPETPFPNEREFSTAKNVLVGTNRMSLDAALKKADELGYDSTILSNRLEGESRDAARLFVRLAGEIIEGKGKVQPPACLLVGGETTVTLRGTGKGGRNQEMALAFLDRARETGLDMSRITFLSGATDGNDGPTDAAGGIADSSSYEAATGCGRDMRAALDENASYDFLGKSGGLFKTGATNTNVCDIQVMIVRA